MDNKTLAMRIVLDVLALRGPATSGEPFRMYAVEPDRLMSPERRALAQRFAALVPQGATVDDAHEHVATIAAYLVSNGGE